MTILPQLTVSLMALAGGVTAPIRSQTQITRRSIWTRHGWGSFCFTIRSCRATKTWLVPHATTLRSIGLGPARKIDPDNIPEERIPRNAPALFNLGASEFTVMFHDGRLEVDASHPGGLRTPMDADMVAGFASVLSAQTMFPVRVPSAKV